MARARNRTRRPEKQRRRTSGTKRRPFRPVTKLTNLILAELYHADGHLGLKDMVRRLAPHRAGPDEITAELGRLCHQGRVESRGKRAFTLGNKTDLFEATLAMSRSGFGFGTDLVSTSGARLPGREPYISRSHLASARHGDRVLLHVFKHRKDGRSEAEVVTVLERGAKTVVGFFAPSGAYGTVQPEDPRFPAAITVTRAPRAGLKAKGGDAVVVRLLRPEIDATGPAGEIVEVLGDPARIEVMTRMVAEKHELPTEFSAAALRDAENAVPDPPAEAREDLRHIRHYTIDGADAKDFDDAVAVEKHDGGYRLFVSIADVAAYVKEGSALDREAYGRGTSVYFPSTVIPMLPDHLSTDLCSLVADRDRLTMTAILEFNRQANLLNTRFTRSVMRSRMRFTYDTVEQIVTAGDPEARRRHASFLTPLKDAAELAKKLQQARIARGSITFTVDEPDIRLEADGTVSEIVKKQRGFAHQMIEEFMLAANVAVARTFAECGRGLLYRIHEKPDPDKIADFVAFSKSLDLKTSRAEPSTPRWYGDLLAEVSGTPAEYIINNLLLRTMQQARYSDINVGHFGLGEPHYTHFTSPIRRYPDLIVHRLLSRLLDGQPDDRTAPAGGTRGRPLRQAAVHLSERERKAVSSERDMADRLQGKFIETRLGERFTAVVSGFSESAFYIVLRDHLVSGTVPLQSLTDDYYLFDHKRHRLIGDVGGAIIKLGDIVDVIATDVVPGQNRIYFALARGPRSKDRSRAAKRRGRSNGERG